MGNLDAGACPAPDLDKLLRAGQHTDMVPQVRGSHPVIFLDDINHFTEFIRIRVPAWHIAQAKGYPPGALLHVAAQDRFDAFLFLICRLSVLRPAHDQPPDGSMPLEDRHIHVAAAAVPVPGIAFKVLPLREKPLIFFTLPIAEQPVEPVIIDGLLNRRIEEGVPAVAAQAGGDPLAHEQFHFPVQQAYILFMNMRVDQPGNDNFAPGVYGFPCAAVQVLPQSFDPPAPYCDIPNKAGCAGTVYNPSIPDEDICHSVYSCSAYFHTCFNTLSAFPPSTLLISVSE